MNRYPKHADTTTCENLVASLNLSFLIIFVCWFVHQTMEFHLVCGTYLPSEKLCTYHGKFKIFGLKQIRAIFFHTCTLVFELYFILNNIFSSFIQLHVLAKSLFLEKMSNAYHIYMWNHCLHKWNKHTFFPTAKSRIPLSSWKILVVQ